MLNTGEDNWAGFAIDKKNILKKIPRKELINVKKNVKTSQRN